MIFKQVFDQKSSTYTYIIASAEGREALIIDPVLENVEDYIKILNQLNLKLVKVIDTHIHADHVTGAGKLRDKTKCVTIMGEHTPTDAVEVKVKDDEIIGLKSTSIKFKGKAKKFLFVCYSFLLTFFILGGYKMQFNYIYYLLKYTLLLFSLQSIEYDCISNGKNSKFFMSVPVANI